MLVTVLVECLQKGWIFSDIPLSVGKFFGVVQDQSSSYQKKIVERAWQFEGVLLTVQGTLPANEFINKLIRKLELPLPDLSEEICKNIYSNCAVEAFSESQFMSKKMFGSIDVPLWGIATTLHTKWDKFVDSTTEFTVDPSILRTFSPSELPIALAAKAVMKSFEEMERVIKSLDSSGQD